MSARVVLLAVAVVLSGCATQAGSVRAGDSSRRHGARYKAGAIVIGGGVALTVVGAALALATLQHSCSISYGDCTDAELRVNQFWAGFGIGIGGGAGAALVGPALMISNAWQRPTAEPR